MLIRITCQSPTKFVGWRDNYLAQFSTLGREKKRNRGGDSQIGLRASSCGLYGGMSLSIFVEIIVVIKLAAIAVAAFSSSAYYGSYSVNNIMIFYNGGS